MLLFSKIKNHLYKPKFVVRFRVTISVVFLFSLFLTMSRSWHEFFRSEFFGISPFFYVPEFGKTTQAYACYRACISVRDYALSIAGLVLHAFALLSFVYKFICWFVKENTNFSWAYVVCRREKRTKARRTKFKMWMTSRTFLDKKNNLESSKLKELYQNMFDLFR